MDDCSSQDDGCASGAPDHAPQHWNRFIDRGARTLARRIKDRALTADDLAQTARVRLFRLGKSQPSLPRNWVGKVLYNEMRREAGKPESPAPLDDDANLVEDHTAETETARVRRMTVAMWIAALPHPLQDTYQALYVDGDSQREAAVKLGLSQSRVSQLKRQLLRRGRIELASLAA